MSANELEKSEPLAEAEERLSAVREEVERARERLQEVRPLLTAAEQRLRTIWTRRKAVESSLTTTMRAAQACGLATSASTRLSIGRYQARIDETKAEIRSVIEGSAEVCRSFEAAWAYFLVARATERSALETVAATTLQLSAADNPARIRQKEVQAELRQLETEQAAENRQRRQELALDSDGHFDPNYDEHELLLRRIRPWL